LSGAYHFDQNKYQHY